MATGATLTTYSNVLKDLYTVKRVEDAVAKGRPLFAMTKKEKKFGGAGKPIPVIYGHPQGVNSQFTNAQDRSQNTSLKTEQFYLTRVSRYGIANISGELARSTMGDDEAFLKAMSTEIDKCVDELSRQLAQQQYGAGWGKIGQAGPATIGVADPTADDITLLNVDDAANFEVGMSCVFAASESGDTLRDSGDQLIVTAVNRSTGVITFAQDCSTVSGLVDSDYIFIEGDRQDSATPTRRCIAGLEAWVPATAPDSTAFFTADRSVDPTRLAGQRKDLSSTPLEEVLIDMTAIIGREGGELTHIFMNWNRWAQLQKTLQARGMVDIETIKVGSVGFSAIVVNGSNGPVRVVADRYCPNNRIWGLNMEHMALHSIGEPVQVADEDGNAMLRVYNADDLESRWVFHGNMALDAPWHFFNAQV